MFVTIRDNLDLDLEEFGIVISLIIIGVLSIGGFFAAGGIGVIYGFTISLWIVSASLLNIWTLYISGPLVAWTFIVIIGSVFAGRKL